MREAIVLAGGLGTRLRPVFHNGPKPMAPIGGRPFLEILLNSFSKKRFSRVILSLGYKANTIVDHFGKNFNGLDLIYAIEDQALGTGGAIRLAMSKCNSNQVYIFNGDTYLDLEIDDIEHEWNTHHTPIIVGRKVADAKRYGTMETKGRRVIRFSEKTNTGPSIINAGAYLLKRTQLDEYKINQPFSFEYDYLTHAVKSSPFHIFITHGQFIDIGIPEDYMRAQTTLADK